MLQRDLAEQDLQQINKQITGAVIKQEIARADLANHDRQIENSAAIEEYLSGKYTGKALYTWQVEQLSSVFFQAYRLAYDLAKRAERAYRFERGLTSTNFIQFGYWDSLRNGLMAPERLYLDLKRMELAYLDSDSRDLEITRNVSLLAHAPLELIKLRKTGVCEMELPETLFADDVPGLYYRRVKTCSVMIPCGVGPYTSLNCTLTLLKNWIRIGSNPADPQFLEDFAARQSIVTGAQNDPGLFELNLRDERYLPFEGAGVVSTLKIALASGDHPRPFDYNTISDVVLQLRYTARDGGAVLKAAETKAVLAESTKPRHLFLSARHDFPNEWHRFVETAKAQERALDLPLTLNRFPFKCRHKNVEVLRVQLFVNLRDEFQYDDAHPLIVQLRRIKELDGTDVSAPPLGPLPCVSAGSVVANVPYTEFEFLQAGTGKLGTWRVEVKHAGEVASQVGVPPPVYPGALDDLWFVLKYEAL
jgi:hypothetical protein